MAPIDINKLLMPTRADLDLPQAMQQQYDPFAFANAAQAAEARVVKQNQAEQALAQARLQEQISQQQIEEQARRHAAQKALAEKIKSGMSIDQLGPATQEALAAHGFGLDAANLTRQLELDRMERERFEIEKQKLKASRLFQYGDYVTGVAPDFTGTMKLPSSPKLGDRIALTEVDENYEPVRPIWAESEEEANKIIEKARAEGRKILAQREFGYMQANVRKQLGEEGKNIREEKKWEKKAELAQDAYEKSIEKLKVSDELIRLRQKEARGETFTQQEKITKIRLEGQERIAQIRAEAKGNDFLDVIEAIQGGKRELSPEEKRATRRERLSKARGE